MTRARRCRTLHRCRVSVPPKRPPDLVGTVFRGRDALRAGLLTKRQLDSSAWRRLFRGVYADADLPVDHALRCLGAHLLLPAQATIAGRSAAYLHGVRLAATDDPGAATGVSRHSRCTIARRSRRRSRGSGSGWCSPGYPRR